MIAIIGKYEEALRMAMLSNDVEALSDLLDDRLIFTGPDVHIFSKDDDLSIHRDRLFASGSVGFIRDPNPPYRRDDPKDHEGHAC
jgi:hypothetical protein